MTRFYRNGEADEMLFVHEGRGTLETIFGPIEYGPGDYLVIPIGTTYRVIPAEGEAQRMLWVESPSAIVPPKRYRNDFGQLLEHSPYCERDLRPPAEMDAHTEAGDFVIEVKTRGRVTAYHYQHHPFDLVGWDGHLWPFAFNISDFEPITGRVHQPPPVHLTFQPRNYVICSFVPRKFDYHPLAIPAPYNHSNINSDEVIYYVAGNFMSRRGVDISSFTVHPAGIPHGPHPGTVEASIGKEATEELAVMIDTFHPLTLTRQAGEMEDPAYPFTLAARRVTPRPRPASSPSAVPRPSRIEPMAGADRGRRRGRRARRLRQPERIGVAERVRLAPSASAQMHSQPGRNRLRLRADRSSGPRRRTCRSDWDMARALWRTGVLPVPGRGLRLVCRRIYPVGWRADMGPYRPVYGRVRRTSCDRISRCPAAWPSSGPLAIRTSGRNGATRHGRWSLSRRRTATSSYSPRPWLSPARLRRPGW